MLARIATSKERNVKIILVTLLILIAHYSSFSQDTTAIIKDTVPETDATDVLRKIFSKKPKAVKPSGQGSFAILPALGYNPSFGFSMGAKISGGRQFGTPPETDYSVFALEAVYTTKNILILQMRHNVFTPGNKLNFQGLDYGIGTGNSNYKSAGLVINEHSTKNSDSTFPIKYNYLRLSEKVYRKVSKDLFIGAGASVDMHSKINDEKISNLSTTPHNRYSITNGFSTSRYSTNGLLLALQYNTREHPIRSYGGVYADMTLRFNQTWLGSTKNSTQLLLDVRKYIGISTKNPHAVLAFWHWASYLLGGTVPYLQLPSTASDTYTRLGRAYTFGRFKGPSFSYFESELRYPITKNKLISGVCFVNMQTASNDMGKKVFSHWQIGGGAGLRILFEKESRTALCIDFAKGQYGSQGFFFGLSEAF
jgi:Omp85 superfamily domain